MEILIQLHSPVSIEVQHSQIIAEGGGQAFPFQGVLLYQDVACVPAFLQEHHPSAVVRSGSPRHHRELVLLCQTLRRVQGEPWKPTTEEKSASVRKTGVILCD